MEPIIVELKDVTKSYRLGKRSVHALGGVSLEIHRGEFVALAGASGSGKTTLLNLIGCLDEPTTGSICVFNTAIQQTTDDALAAIRSRNIGFIFQNFNLIPVLSAIENVEYSLAYTPINKRERRAAAVDALARVGLGDRMEHRPDELSGGQRQRVAIARAIAHNPQLIVADEPTAALDRKTASEILDLLISIQEKLKITIVLASHDQAVLTRTKRILHIADGKIERSEAVR